MNLILGDCLEKMKDIPDGIELDEMYFELAKRRINNP